jgi:MFS family permease
LEREKLKYSKKWYSLVGLSLVSFTAFLDFSIVTIAIPFIQHAFRVSVMQLQWVSTIFTTTLALTMILAGRLGDRFGRLQIFYFGFVFFYSCRSGRGNVAEYYSVNCL